jgi:ribose transport system ATP-binding protein
VQCASKAENAASTMRRSDVPLLEMRNISKRFPGISALSDVSIELFRGEVHMLLGANGAGKSTLMKILFGAYPADEGDLLFDGQMVEMTGPVRSRELGVAVIFQEFSLVPYLNIAENIFLGREPPGRLPGTVDSARMHAESRRLLDLLGVPCDTRRLAHDLGIAQQQSVEIAKALSNDARVLVMDEPTAALSDRECDALFSVIRQLKAKGVAIVHISHRLPEVFALGDRISVLRDGKKVASTTPAETNPAELVHMMIGRTLDGSKRETGRRPSGAIPALVVKDLVTETGVRGVSLQVNPGEIVGLTGLVGAGRTEVARAVFGLDRVLSGEVQLWGNSFSGGPHEAVRLGVALISEDRKREGLALMQSIRENTVAASLSKLFPLWFSPRKADRFTAELMKKLGIAATSSRQITRVLSGGNQQKVVISKWLLAGSKLLIFDEPTRGIDVGAKAEIFAVIDTLVDQGAAVLMISSELAEVVALCDRAYVMREGRIAGELSHQDLSESAILSLSMDNG